MKAPPRRPPARVRWEVLPVAGIVGWRVLRNGVQQCAFFFKFRAVSFAVAECNHEYDEWGIRSELLIHGRDGRYQDGRTYGADPRDIKG